MKLTLSFLFLTVFCTLQAIAQPSHWAKLAERGDVTTLLTLEQSGKLTETWIVLVQAMQTPDAKFAQPLYEKAITLDPSGPAGKFAKQRLRQLQAFVAVPFLLSTDTLTGTKNSGYASPKSPNAPGEIPSAKSPATLGNSDLPFVAQFGSFTKKGTAEGIAKTLKNYGFSAEVVSIVIGDKTMWRIWSGRFATEKEAAEKISAVKAKTSLDGVILRAQ